MPIPGSVSIMRTTRAVSVPETDAVCGPARSERSMSAMKGGGRQGSRHPQPGHHARPGGGSLHHLGGQDRDRHLYRGICHIHRHGPVRGRLRAEPSKSAIAVTAWMRFENSVLITPCHPSCQPCARHLYLSRVELSQRVAYRCERCCRNIQPTRHRTNV